MAILKVISVVFAAYALGFFVTGYYLVRWRTGKDLRTLGSGSLGAKNAGRLLGRGGYFTTSLLDIAKGFAALPAHQPMNALNRTVHAAAFCSVHGEILLAREDVGRHNALDKLIGAMARKIIEPQLGFALMSSRCSSELVQKCASVGISALATISAPTSLAFNLAKQAGLKLATRAPQGIMLFQGDDIE